MTRELVTNAAAEPAAGSLDPTPLTLTEESINSGSSGRPHRFWRRVVQQRSTVVALSFLLLLVIAGVLAPLLSPYDPNDQDLRAQFADPLTAGHVLGTDELGRDTLSRLFHATPNALLSAAGTVMVAILLGMPPGLLAGYMRGKLDFGIMRIADALQSFPPLIFAIAIVAIMGPGLRNTMLALGILFAPSFLRLTRAVVLDVREEAYIEASRSIGTPPWRIVGSRVLPNVLPPLLVQTALAAGFALLAESSLSFLGLGVQPPDPSWGAMVARGYTHLSTQPWLIIFPGVLIGLTVLAFNAIGDGLRNAIGRESGQQ